MDKITAWRKRKLVRLCNRFLRMDSKDGDKLAAEISTLQKRIREDAEGVWRTTSTGNHIYINGEGEVTKGNPEIVEALNGEKQGKASSKGGSGAPKAGKTRGTKNSAESTAKNSAKQPKPEGEYSWSNPGYRQNPGQNSGDLLEEAERRGNVSWQQPDDETLEGQPTIGEEDPESETWQNPGYISGPSMSAAELEEFERNGGLAALRQKQSAESEVEYPGLEGEGPERALESGGASEFGTKYTPTYQTNSGVSFPKIKDGAVYDEDVLREVNRLAKEGGFDDAYDEVVRNLTEDDIVYQRDPEGHLVASIPGLSQMYNSEVVGKSDSVQDAYDQRIERGRKITDDMIAISDSLGSRMMGLENCFKGGDSTARKIDKVKSKNSEELSDDAALGKMDDVVRYTFKCGHDTMAQQIVDFESELKRGGYEIVERDNKFLPTSDGKPRNYKAVHLQVKSPDGEVFEVQIHSEESVKVKNQNHEHFERQRKINLKEEPERQGEFDRLEEIMVRNTAAMREPPGIRDLPTFKQKK